ncbi:LPXTG cell wall anchor domain-containing protein [Catenulispora pinisilvae]|uniref:LPXTG cell wall anchor domain-containing protein n=1 Tax=Catenulispora pinisilvae TaxID=2705253 RepID=UPI001891F8A7|nr:LPXTG cell wall anchor domain-containing protein [Catenulispora pinisilvae]
MGRRRRGSLLFASVAALTVTAFGALPAAASAAGSPATPSGSASGSSSSSASSPSPGTAKAVAGRVDLDVQLLPAVLGGLHLTGPNGLDLPLVNLALGEADAPDANGDSANFTNSVVRLHDNLIDTLHLPGPEADLIKADLASGTARVIRGTGGYTQAYATVANLRVFLPLVTLPGASADNGILKLDAISAQATCVPGQKPVASAKMPATITLLGQDIPVPLSGDVSLDLGVVNADVHLSPVTTTDQDGASASVEARVTVDGVGLVNVSGGLTLASASCTTPGVPAVGVGAGTPTTGASSSAPATNSSGAAATSKAKTAAAAATSSAGTAPVALSEKTGGTLAHTGASGSLLPMAVIAIVLVVGGAGLVVFLRKKAAGLRPKE